MAAAALSGCRGAAGGRSTKGLFFIFSLLCVLCLASSLIEKSQLEEAKENVERAQEQLKRTKARLSEIKAKSKTKVDRIMAFVKEASEVPHDFPQLDESLQSMKDKVEQIKTFINNEKEIVEAEIDKQEQELENLMKVIKISEKYHIEL